MNSPCKRIQLGDGGSCSSNRQPRASLGEVVGCANEYDSDEDQECADQSDITLTEYLFTVT